MGTNGVKKLLAVLVAIISAFAAVGCIAKTKKKSTACSCTAMSCTCGSKNDGIAGETADIPPQATRPRSKEYSEYAGTLTKEALRDVFANIKDESISNDTVAKVITGLINLQNVIHPEQAVDVRNIHFMKYGANNTMVIDLYTAVYGKPAHGEELTRLWRDVFLADDFWNADFAKVRINVRDKKSGELCEVILCGLDDVRSYLLREVSIEAFKQSWTRKPADAAQDKRSTKKNGTAKTKKQSKLKHAQ
ncbi:MAG TPA: hypothetical protein VGK02_07530 [Candidatus Aquicultor sp.]|jgi:hypothetical protein